MGRSRMCSTSTPRRQSRIMHEPSVSPLLISTLLDT
ncbi:hypothetical protein FOIG_16017 [Fusarium odoratissimum NRRL 54006]|uniref:Uncharacterized protein n=1 Tax=Fusarium odoratissimum (strain NRRL 54006) TaxID=1089451 RepID=X0IPD0_FUSO5|nr:uncharacterized protein FOIG_16017 [Fusarium odoratissimum NRRL 54006]EXL90722.1 hypothetical protein FOIG_16017 [Fusarium odoratissimum NRRL 54006]